MSQELTDDRLMELLQRGETAAFNVLFRRHHRAVYAIAKAILGFDGGPEEVMHDAFLTLLRKCTSYQPQGKFKVWLLKIARNKALTKLEGERNRRRLFEQTGFTLVDNPAAAPSPARQVELDERQRLVGELISRLPDDQREALSLYALEGMKYVDIAECLDLPINTVKTKIRTARLHVAAALDHLESAS